MITINVNRDDVISEIYSEELIHYIYNTGHEEYILKGQAHRKDGPAIITDDGSKYWYKNGLFHRENGPAIEYSGGNKCWYINGKYHREDGPAIEYSNGNVLYYIDDVLYSKKEYTRIIKLLYLI